MKTYYLATRDGYLAGPHIFHESSFIDLPNGMVIVAGIFRREEDEPAWAARSNVWRLPHPLSPLTVGDMPAALQTILLAAGFVATDTAWNIAQKLAAIHPGMAAR